MRSLNLLSPLRGELELKTYGRQNLIKLFHEEKPLSLPYQLFTDGFGIHRSIYRSLMGVYMIPAGMTAEDRAKRENVFTITVGPHSSNCADVIEALIGLTALNQGVQVGNRAVFAVPFCFLADILQQNDNTGIKRPTAIQSCRMCLIPKKQRADIYYEIVKMGRYHYQLLLHRKLDEKRSAAAKNRVAQEYGLSVTLSLLTKIAPSLNLVTFFPSDPCQSEYADMSKNSHHLLVTYILTSAAAERYVSILQRLLFPFGMG
ncbi:hypothetical protein BDW74DRAFT_173015 [Aspergillus multicolor]|uniref:uncharacterized protein n=1 Tax=Aspergillus multicolor TaxID=41759 RepID=UPI003CCE1A0D